jgi:F0F1-type ATP synthase membrane subunit b/b'
MPSQADQNRPRGDFEAAKTEITDKLQQEKRTATEAFHDARDEVAQKVEDYTAEAKEALFKRAEGTQRDISSNLRAFGGALRAASEHLANSDQRTASKFVLDAAGGMERLSASLKDRPFEEVLEEIRSFGRDNSGALIAGSVLAGLALGRFVKSSTPASGSATGSAPGTNPQTGDGPSMSSSSSDQAGSNGISGERD